MKNRKTLKNKIMAIAILIIGFIPVLVYQDVTLLIIAGCFAIPLFFTKRNWIF